LKFVLIALIIVVGIFALFVTIGISPLERNLSEAANTSAVELLGSNYSQFSGMPELLA
jgi:type II secretory pathway pseudopilin PulG